MECEKDVLHLQKKLEKIMKEGSGQEQVLDYLKALKDLPVNLATLTSTRIGMTVNSIRKKSYNEEVNNLTKVLIKKWKKFIPANPKESSKSETKAPEKMSEMKEKHTTTKESPDNKEKRGSTSTGGAVPVSFPALPSTTTDSVRLKCRELLCIAIKGDGLPVDGGADPDFLADRLEQHIYDEFKNTDMKYKNRIRSRVANLKDSRNPLRLNFLCGEISPARLAVMTSEEMASDEMKRMRSNFTKEGIDKAQLATVQGTQTDLLRCGKCGKRNCTYNQIQTRSADEPMTTFVLCNECGNRWKFC